MHLSQASQEKMDLVLQVTSANAILFYFALFLLVLLVIKFKKPGSTKYKFPPSPSKLPFIGNLHQMRGTLHQTLFSLAHKHGPLMLLHFGGVPTLVVSSVDTARDVLKTYDHVFASRPEMMITNRLFYGKNMGFAPYGDYWRQVRKICVTRLLSVKKVQSFQFVREEEIALMMEKIQQSSLVNLSKMYMSLSNGIICRVAFGRKYNKDDRGERNFKEILKDFVDLVSTPNMADLIPSLAWLNHLNGLNARLEKSFLEFDTFLNEVVEDHIEKKRRSGEGGGVENEEDDFVDVMLSIEKDHSLGFSFARESTKALILDMFTAGTDTTSVLLEWIMSELLKNPKIMEEVQNEVRGVARGKFALKECDTEEMHYLKSVIKETLRMHPPLPLLAPHELTENVKLQGYDIPAKTTVMINAYAIGRDPLWWEEPEKFWPKRFLNGCNASLDFRGQDFHYIPFGAGRRGCPGIFFATSMLEVALANLLNRFDWELPNAMDGEQLDMQESWGMTVHRKKELLVVAKPHRKIS